MLGGNLGSLLYGDVSVMFVLLIFFMAVPEILLGNQEEDRSSLIKPHMRCVMRKLTFCICENKDADQLRGDCAADQRLCFCYTDSTITLHSKSKFSSL